MDPQRRPDNFLDQLGRSAQEIFAGLDGSKRDDPKKSAGELHELRGRLAAAEAEAAALRARAEIAEGRNNEEAQKSSALRAELKRARDDLAAAAARAAELERMALSYVVEPAGESSPSLQKHETPSPIASRDRGHGGFDLTPSSRSLGSRGGAGGDAPSTR